MQLRGLYIAVNYQVGMIRVEEETGRRFFISYFGRSPGGSGEGFWKAQLTDRCFLVPFHSDTLALMRHYHKSAAPNCDV